MPFYEVLSQFLRVSGRDDLGTIGDVSTAVDNGAGRFINAGQKLLDKIAETHSSWTRWQKDVSAGAFQVTPRNMRAIRDVYVTSSEGQWRLEKKTMRELRAMYSKPISTLDQGMPLFYAPNIIRLGGDQVDLDNSDYDEIFTRDDEDLDLDCDCPEGALRGIYLMPPSDGSYTVTVIAKFYSKKLVELADESYWTEVDDTALLYAALYSMERFYRNTEGAKDWLDAMRLELQGTDYDLAEEDSNDINDIVR